MKPPHQGIKSFLGQIHTPNLNSCKICVIVTDSSKSYKLLIDKVAELSVFKPVTSKRFKNRFPEHVVFPGVSDQKIFRNEHKVYICKLDIKLEVMLGSDFHEEYNYIIHFNGRKLITKRFLYSKSCMTTEKIIYISFIKVNTISLKPRMEHIFNFQC